MREAREYRPEEAHLYFAQSLNGRTWELLEAPQRSKADDELMLFFAYASCYHWLHVGSGLNHQRAQWLMARVYSELGLAEPALRHAARCLELTREYDGLMQELDTACAYAGMARASALMKNEALARQYAALAEEAGRAIQNAADQEIFWRDFNRGPWYGVR